MEIIDKKTERKNIRKAVQMRVNKTKDNLWALLTKELILAKKEYKTVSDLAAKCGVNPAQIDKWIEGQGKDEFRVETFFKIIYGLDISMARVLMAISPRRAKILRAFSTMTGSEFDKLAQLNDQQINVLKGIILGYLQSVPSKSKKSELNNN